MKDIESDRINDIQKDILENLRKKNDTPSQDPNWKFDRNAFYTSGLDSTENLEQRFNVYDAPVGYKWVTYKNPNYDFAKLKDKQFMALFSPYASEITEQDRYPYLWHRQKIDMDESSSQGVGVSPPENSDTNFNGPIPVNNNNNDNNNALTLYGAPKPIAGVLPPNLPQTSQSSQTNIPNTNDIPKMQGNSKIGTVGETNRLPTESLKQNALYSLFANPQKDKAETNNFVF